MEVEAAVRRGELRSQAGVSRAAERLDVPEAALRGAASFYADLTHASNRLRVCRGTSCFLADGQPGVEAVPAGQRTVYCLGYCDRSPAVLVGDDWIVLGDAARALRAGSGLEAAEGSPALAGPPALRCTAREPLVLRRALRGDFSELAAARADGAYSALARATRTGPASVLDAVERSRHRGRGGAAFPTGTKWRLCAEAADPERYVVANGDEGDPGCFVDRVLMERDPHGVLEGLLLAGYAVGAARGYVFVRSEYPHAIGVMERAVRAARAEGILGPSVMDSAFAFDVDVVRGLGSYVCGEETALLNAIEGRRGEVRIRPPYPTERGLWDHPTVVNNVESLVSVPVIVERGADEYAALGTAACSGTKTLCFNHGFARPGIVEVEFGATLGGVIADAGGGAHGAELEAVLLGGPMGSVVTPPDWDVQVCYGAMGARGIQLGHGGVVAVPEGTDTLALLRHWLDFMRDESCGRCVPCARGSAHARSLIDGAAPAQRARLERLLDVMEAGSLCAFGQSMPAPMRQLLDHFGTRVFADGGRP
jgi:NADH:ubiquinone oxidoreductase subunit F (NADH-binding)